MSKTFIDVEYIESLLAKHKSPDKKQVEEVIEHARKAKGLSPEQVAVLLGLEDEDMWQDIFKLAKELKQSIYGRRIVFFAPLYVSNYCVNRCEYCAFRSDNSDSIRHALTQDELREEILALENVGHKRVLMVYGQHPKYGLDYMLDTIKTVYDTKTPDGKGEIRRLNVNAAPMKPEECKALKEAGVGTFQVFQETYHPGMYGKFHPANTPKGDYKNRLYALHKAQEGGLDDVAIGALFGLYDWRFEVMGLLMHAMDLEKEFNVGPHTVSFPRLEPAINTPLASQSPYLVSDKHFKRLVAIIRLMVPYTGMILTAREKPEIRHELFALGISQIDAGSCIAIGGYKAKKEQMAKQQFKIYDDRSLDVVARELVDLGYLPSFCTACYRLNRTGEHFMSFAKDGWVKNFCQPNAIMTFMEYLTDYASAETKLAGEKLIANEMKDIDETRLAQVKEKLESIANGKRDLFF